MKRYLNSAFGYAIAAMVFGVFYREFTKFSGFTGQTTLSVMHTHYFAMGMLVFLLLAVLENQLHFTTPRTRVALGLYHGGLNLTAGMLLLRGVLQVWGTALTTGQNAAISGVAGIGHILLGVGLILLLMQLRKSAQPRK